MLVGVSGVLLCLSKLYDSYQTIVDQFNSVNIMLEVASIILRARDLVIKLTSNVTVRFMAQESDYAQSFAV